MPRALRLGTTAPFVVTDGARRIGQRLKTACAVEAGKLQTGLESEVGHFADPGFELDPAEVPAAT
jgi:hypothetical protein